VISVSQATVIAPPGATVPSGSFTLDNTCGKDIQVNTITVGVSDIGVISGMSVSGSAPAGPSSNSVPPKISVQPNVAGTGTFTLTPPLPIHPGTSGNFDFQATISSTAGSSKSSTQTLTKVDTTAAGVAVPVGPLPGTLSNISTP
jgi:hypothetical protein